MDTAARSRDVSECTSSSCEVEIISHSRLNSSSLNPRDRESDRPLRPSAFDGKSMQKHTEETSGDSSPRRCKSGKCACWRRRGFSRNPLRKSRRPRTFVNGLAHVDASEFAKTLPRKNYLKFSGSVVVFSGVATVLLVFAASLEESAPVGIGVKKTSTRRFSWLPRAPLVAMGRNSP